MPSTVFLCTGCVLGPTREHHMTREPRPACPAPSLRKAVEHAHHPAQQHRPAGRRANLARDLPQRRHGAPSCRITQRDAATRSCIPSPLGADTSRARRRCSAPNYSRCRRCGAPRPPTSCAPPQMRTPRDHGSGLLLVMLTVMENAAPKWDVLRTPCALACGLTTDTNGRS